MNLSETHRSGAEAGLTRFSSRSSLVSTHSGFESFGRRNSVFGSSMSDRPTTRTKNDPIVEGNLRFDCSIDCESSVMYCCFTPDGTVLCVGLANGLIKIYSFVTMTSESARSTNFSCLQVLQDDEVRALGLPCTQIHFRRPNQLSPPGLNSEEYAHILIASYSSGKIKFWHYTSGSCLFTINEERQTLCFAPSPDGSKLVTGGDDGVLHLYDEATKTEIRTLAASEAFDIMDGHRARIFSAMYHPLISNVFISSGWDDTIQFWDDRQEHSVRKIIGPHVCGNALDIDPTHNHILSGSWRRDDCVQIWDWVQGTLVKTVPDDYHTRSQLYAGQWMGRDSILVGGSEQHVVRLIDRGSLNTTGLVFNFPSGVYCVDNDRNVSGGGPKIAAGSGEKIFLFTLGHR